MGNAKKDYPEPFERPDSKCLYFSYTENGKRKQRSTGKTLKREARQEIKRFIDLLNPGHDITFRQYSKPFFVWTTCPRVQRRIDEGKSIGRTHVEKSRRWLDKHVLNDPFADLRIREIKRGDILDLRSRLREKVGLNTVNKVIDTVKTVLSEAYYRQDIDFDPGARIGDIEYVREKRGVFSPKDIKELFGNPELFGPAYLVFYTAALTGMRSGEILALTWEQIDGDVITIDRAWKSAKELGPPKWGKIRTIPICDKLHTLLDKCGQFDLVFHHKDGSRLGETYWRKSFYTALERLGYAKRISKPKESPRWESPYTPHSFRHSLNTNLIAAGMSPYLVGKYLAHSRKELILTPTQEGYTHIQVDHLRPVAELIQKLYCQ